MNHFDLKLNFVIVLFYQIIYFNTDFYRKEWFIVDCYIFIFNNLENLL